ncbi:MAG: hypothetical protein NTW87_24985 [Planctomycetota bacterium]|nr:hypothetical protein [Planctomycetota bacterium]
MRTRRVCLLALVGFAIGLLSVPAMAAGQGTTKIDFKLTIGDAASSRIFIKRDISATSGQLPEVGSKSINDNLAGQTVTLFIGSAGFSGTADEKGKVTTPFTAKITGNGKGLQIKATGLNLEQLLPVDPTDGDHQVTVQIKVTASRTDAATGQVTEVVLSDASETLFYKAKKGKVKGKNF